MKNIANIITKALLLMCMMVSSTMVWAEEPEPTPTGEVGTAAQLMEAIANNEIATVKLTANIPLTSTLTIRRDVTIDLNGNNLTSTGVRTIHITSGVVKIKSSDSPGMIAVTGSINNTESSVIRVGDPSENSIAASLTIGENVTISTDLCYGVTIFGKNTAQTLDVDGKISTKVRPAISGHGDFSGTVITIGEKAEISTTDDVAIYHPQDGNLTVNGKVTGAGGIEMKGGTIVVGETASIEATTQTPTHAVNNDGTSTRGYAIAIVENGKYAGVSTVNISKGATITGPVSVVKDSDKKPESPEISFDQNGLQMSVKVTDNDGKSFGQYQTLTEAFKDAPTDCTVTLLDNCSLTSTIATTHDFTLNLNGHNINSNGDRAFHIKSGTVTFTGTGVINVPAIDNPDKSVIRVGDNNVTEAVSLTVENSVTISSDVCYGITIFGKNTTETLTVNGKVNTKIRPAISGNGLAEYAATTVTIGETAEIITTDEVAVYHPQAGTLTVSGKVNVVPEGSPIKINHSTGIEIKGGTLVVNPTAHIVGVGTPTHNAKTDDTSTRGYAIAIVENKDGYGKGQGVTAVTIAKGNNDTYATIEGIVAQLQDSPISDSYNPTIQKGDQSMTTVAGIGDDKYFSLNDAISVVPATGTVKLLAAYATASTYVMSAEKTYTLDLNGHNFTGTNCAAIQIAGGHVTIKNSRDAEKKVTVSGTTTDPVIKLGSSDIANNRNVSLTIDETAIVDGSDITSGIYLSGSKTRETLIVKGKVLTNGKIAILGDKDHGGTTIQIEGGTVTATNAVAIYHPQSGDLIIDGRENQGGVVKATVSGSGAIEMKGGDLTITKDATITATAGLNHPSEGQEDAPSTDGYAIALVEHEGFTGVGKVNISNQASIPGVIACLVDSKNNAVAAPVFNGDVQMVAETNSEKYASLPNAITACADGGEVKFLDDINITEGFTINKKLTIDMDDYSIIGKQESDATNKTVMTISADVTLKNGGVTSDKDGVNGFSVTAGTVTLQQMTVNTKGVSLAVSGGTVTIDAKSSFSSSADNTLALSGGTTTLSGKVYNTSTGTNKNAIVGTSDAVLTAESTIVVSSAKGNGIDWGSTGALTVKGGKVMGTEAVYASNGTVTIEGGTFTGTGHALNVVGGTPHVTGGTYICGSADTYKPITATSAKGFVSGNTTYFSKKIAQNLCTTGFMVSTNPKTNGYYYLIDEIIINDATVWTVPTSPYTIHKAKYVRNSGMGANGTKYGTLCLPFTFSATQTGMKFYTVDRIEGNSLYITQTSGTDGKIVAGTPVIFEFENTTTNFTIESTDAAIPAANANSTNSTDNKLQLVGTFSNTVLDTNNSTTKVNEAYYLNGDAFHKASETLTVPAFRAYIKIVPPASSARTLYIHTDNNDTTDIDDVLLDDEVEGVYDIQGRKQNGLQNGMNIMRMSNGKTIKVIVNK